MLNFHIEKNEGCLKVTAIIDNSTEEARKRWCELLRTAWMYHQQMVKDLEGPIMGAEITDDQIFHMGISVAIQDAIELIQQLEAYEYFDDEDRGLSKAGPAG